MLVIHKDKYSASHIDSAVGFDLKTGECQFILDEIKDGTFSGNADINWSTGKQGRRLAALKSNKTCNIEINNGFITGGLIRAQFGDNNPEVGDGVTTFIAIPTSERIKVGAGGTIELAKAAVGVAGNEISLIYKANKDGSQGASYVQGDPLGANAETEFTLDSDMKTITLPTGPAGNPAFVEGDTVLVFYNYESAGVKYQNYSGNYAGAIRLVCNIVTKDLCTDDETMSVLEFHKLNISDNFNYSFSGSDMAVQNLQGEASASICDGEAVYCTWYLPESA